MVSGCFAVGRFRRDYDLKTTCSTVSTNKLFFPCPVEMHIFREQVVANKPSVGKVVARWSMRCTGAIEAGSTRTGMPSIYACGQVVYVCIAYGSGQYFE